MSWKMTLEELVAGTEGKVVSQLERTYTGVGTDTRADLKGKIFFALKGDNFDAHDFLTKAQESGAAAIVVHKWDNNSALADKVTVIQVDDTLKAMQRLGNFWRRKSTALFLGVTGTNGKTTTKEFSAALIGSRKNVQYSKGSFNNHWGVPISILSVESQHEVAVIEMGMNHPGELKELSHIVEADAVLCTMVGRGHLEGVGSIEGAAEAKSEIYQHAKDGAFKIFNLENEYTRKMFVKYGRGHERVLTFASSEFAKDTKKAGEAWPALDVSLGVMEVGIDWIRIRGEIQGVAGETKVPVFGRQNVTNLMAAACFGLVSGLTPAQIWEALPLCKTAWGRNQWVDLKSGAKALFDAYNANPESMRAAVENFALLKTAPAKKVAILGEMREMGSHASDVHRELGRVAATAGFDHIAFFGASKDDFAAGLKDGGFQKTSFITDSYKQTLAPEAWPMLREGDLVLIKGSRGMQLEKALSDLSPVSFEAKK